MTELLVGLLGVLIGYFAKSQLDQDRDALGRYEDNKEKEFLHERDRLEELYELVDSCKTKYQTAVSKHEQAKVKDFALDFQVPPRTHMLVDFYAPSLSIKYDEWLKALSTARKKIYEIVEIGVDHPQESATALQNEIGHATNSLLHAITDLQKQRLKEHLAVPDQVFERTRKAAVERGRDLVKGTTELFSTSKQEKDKPSQRP